MANSQRQTNLQNKRSYAATETVDLIVSLLVGTSVSLIGKAPSAQETEVVAGGELEFQNYCAVCHGVDGKGRGIMSKFLTVQPADLTQITRKNSGTFSFWQVYRIIDGREDVRGHGTRDMPIWGDRFRAQSGGNDAGSRAQARAGCSAWCFICSIFKNRSVRIIAEGR